MLFTTGVMRQEGTQKNFCLRVLPYITMARSTTLWGACLGCATRLSLSKGR